MFKIKPYKFHYFRNKSWRMVPFKVKARKEWSSFKRHAKNEIHRAQDEAGMAINRLIARITSADLYWSYEDQWGEEQDLEYLTAAAAFDNAQEAFDDYCNDNIESPFNGQEEEADIMVFQFFYDEKTGDRRITRKQFETVSWEYYHGDLKEHGTWGI